MHETKLQNTILQDVDLEAYTDYECYLKAKDWANAIPVKVESDEGDSFELKLPTDISIYEFKRVVLNKRQNHFFWKKIWEIKTLSKI